MIDFFVQNKLFSGWLLGIISAAINPFLTGIIERHRFRAAIAAELNELRIPLASYVYLLSSNIGALTRETLEWCILEFQKSPPTEERNRLLDGLLQQRQLTNKQVAEVHTQREAGIGKAVPKLSLPYLKTKPELIALVSTEEQKSLVKILNHLEVLNSRIDDMTYWDRLTFQTNTDENHQRVLGNSEKAMNATIQACKRLAGLIDLIVTE